MALAADVDRSELDLLGKCRAIEASSDVRSPSDVVWRGRQIHRGEVGGDQLGHASADDLTAVQPPRGRVGVDDDEVLGLDGQRLWRVLEQVAIAPLARAHDLSQTP